MLFYKYNLVAIVPAEPNTVHPTHNNKNISIVAVIVNYKHNTLNKFT